jgi:hypothetical protein
LRMRHARASFSPAACSRTPSVGAGARARGGLAATARGGALQRHAAQRGDAGRRGAPAVMYARPFPGACALACRLRMPAWLPHCVWAAAKPRAMRRHGAAQLRALVSSLLSQQEAAKPQAVEHHFALFTAPARPPSRVLYRAASHTATHTPLRGDASEGCALHGGRRCVMSASKRARVSGSTQPPPFGSTSRLVACPVCGKRVHLLLAASHVESHFGDLPGEEPPPAGTEPAAVREEHEDVAHTAHEGAAGGSEPESGADDGVLFGGAAAADGVPFGGAHAPPPPTAEGQTSTYVPGADAVWKPFKLQARLRELCMLARALHPATLARLTLPCAAPGHERRLAGVRAVPRALLAGRARPLRALAVSTCAAVRRVRAARLDAAESATPLSLVQRQTGHPPARVPAIHVTVNCKARVFQ